MKAFSSLLAKLTAIFSSMIQSVLSGNQITAHNYRRLNTANGINCVTYERRRSLFNVEMTQYQTHLRIAN